jgi:hypothetical protein
MTSGKPPTPKPADTRSAGLLTALFAAWILAGCAGYHPAAPAGFAVYPRGIVFKSPLRAVSPDGILFTVRTEKNKPRADLGFWREAMKTRMAQSGYRLAADTLCKMKGADGILLEMAAPMGDQDYFYWVAFALSPSGDRILVAEAAGESKRFLPRREEIRKAIAASGF